MILTAGTAVEIDGALCRLRVTSHTAGTLELQGTLVEPALRVESDWTAIQAALVNNTSYDVTPVYAAIRVTHASPGDSAPRLALAVRRGR